MGKWRGHERTDAWGVKISFSDHGQVRHQIAHGKHFNQFTEYFAPRYSTRIMQSITDFQ